MLQRKSIINCADNSGAKKLSVITVLGAYKSEFATLGDIVVCAVKGANSNSTVKDHEVVRAVVVRVKKELRRKDGSYIRFDDNAGIVIDKNNVPRSTRVFGPVAREIRDAGFTKIASLAKEVW
ncbi:50S ribosomal protein L14 [candidate division WWE3 bacterium CG10_big_fil_rev_8_21_14_0_10_32_10]|uniref:Large ribosomal subunit protein uL14 n=1 Tax=candidate division WWE3 bacterium CG10_big_fil_rev_8_21_14_0_10_32_10 TaxID=1975090 RepID=A0A2H0RB01_UNCKA|nr:MAG: 50S ribosomal protein L14 [candidate division WWE3 bacterium CG10_big_fil_rev_8_21_14_0_10_32_10]